MFKFLAVNKDSTLAVIKLNLEKEKVIRAKKIEDKQGQLEEVLNGANTPFPLGKEKFLFTNSLDDTLAVVKLDLENYTVIEAKKIKNEQLAALLHWPNAPFALSKDTFLFTSTSRRNHVTRWNKMV